MQVDKLKFEEVKMKFPGQNEIPKEFIVDVGEDQTFVIRLVKSISGRPAKRSRAGSSV